MAASVERWRDNRALLAALELDPRELTRRLELAEHEAAEISDAHIRAGEADEIRGRLDAARHGEAIARDGAALVEALTADETGARDRVAAAVRAARGVARLEPRFAGPLDRLEGLEAEIDDIAAVVREIAESVDHDPVELARLSDRVSIDLLARTPLRRRRGGGHRSRRARGGRGRTAPRCSGEERRAREAEDGRLLERIAAAARRPVGSAVDRRAPLAGAWTALVELGFPRACSMSTSAVGQPATMNPAVEVDGDALAFDASGIDQVAFRLAPNAGEPPRPLARIASAGSRAASRSRSARSSRRPTTRRRSCSMRSTPGSAAAARTRSAEACGASPGATGPVLTHLPQIAAYADAHFRIEKRERAGRTVTEVVRLDATARIAELAEMIGGAGAGVIESGPIGGQPSWEPSTPTAGAGAVSSARELVDRATAFRARARSDG